MDNPDYRWFDEMKQKMTLRNDKCFCVLRSKGDPYILHKKYITLLEYWTHSTHQFSYILCHDHFLCMDNPRSNKIRGRPCFICHWYMVAGGSHAKKKNQTFLTSYSPLDRLAYSWTNAPNRDSLWSKLEGLSNSFARPNTNTTTTNQGYYMEKAQGPCSEQSNATQWEY